MLIALRALQGIGSAMVFGTGVAIITSVYPPKERGKAIGITVTSVYIGLSIGPISWWDTYTVSGLAKYLLFYCTFWPAGYMDHMEIYQRRVG